VKTICETPRQGVNSAF